MRLQFLILVCVYSCARQRGHCAPFSEVEENYIWECECKSLSSTYNLNLNVNSKQIQELMSSSERDDTQPAISKSSEPNDVTSSSQVDHEEISVEKKSSLAFVEDDNAMIFKLFVDNDTEVAWIEDTIILKTYSSLNEIEKIAEQYMQYVNEINANETNRAYLSAWAFSSNITDFNKNISMQSLTHYGAFIKQQWLDLQTWKDFWPNFSNESLKRQFKLYSVLGVPALPEDKYAKFVSIKAERLEIYSTATICDFYNSSKCDLALEPDLTALLAKSRDYDELTHVWKEWRDASGKKMKDLYTQYVNLSNEAAEFNGFPSMAEMWIYPYESETFEKDVTDLFQQISPLYNQLHAYVRRKLREVYGEEKVTKTGAIPAHLLGNMWAQTWDRIYGILMPYTDRTSLDVTDSMIAQNYTPQKIFETADDFFASLGLERVDSSFWNKSILEKPTDRKLVCHASAWDFYDSKDFRIKQCTQVNMEDLSTAHHEMGHIQYDIQYKSLPHVLKGGANKGFHEAIGDVMSLSVNTPKHLHKIGLLYTEANEYEDDINFLMISALRKVAFLPFGYLIDRFRWDTFRGLISPDNYTCAWWNYRYDLQGVQPPVPRTSADFDPGAKYHVAANVQYVRYFVSYVLQFQFHKSLCLLAGVYDPTDPQKPLHQCDIYQSVEAGNALRDLLKMGSSQHWSVTLKALTGTDKMDLSALREYFKPLEEWLQEDNKKHGEFIGWEGGHGVC